MRQAGLSFPDIILFCEPKFFLISAQSGFFCNVQTRLFFNNRNSRLYKQKKSKTWRILLTNRLLDTECQTSTLPSFLQNCFVWLSATQKCNVHISLGSWGGLESLPGGSVVNCCADSDCGSGKGNTMQVNQRCNSFLIRAKTFSPDENVFTLRLFEHSLEHVNQTGLNNQHSFGVVIFIHYITLPVWFCTVLFWFRKKQTNTQACFQAALV